jgi:hypothetical protein
MSPARKKMMARDKFLEARLNELSHGVDCPEDCARCWLGNEIESLREKVAINDQHEERRIADVRALQKKLDKALAFVRHYAGKLDPVAEHAKLVLCEIDKSR